MPPTRSLIMTPAFRLRYENHFDSSLSGSFHSRNSTHLLSLRSLKYTQHDKRLSLNILFISLPFVASHKHKALTFFKNVLKWNLYDNEAATTDLLPCMVITATVRVEKNPQIVSHDSPFSIYRDSRERGNSRKKITIKRNFLVINKNFAKVFRQGWRNWCRRSEYTFIYS